MSFNKVKAEDLLFVANNDLDLDLPESLTKAQVLAAIAEKQITWAEAIELSPTIAAIQEAMDTEKAVKAAELAAVEREAEAVRTAAREGATVTTQAVKGNTLVEEKTVVVTPEVVVTKQTTRPAQALIRMDRENPTFQIRGYKFTQEHPYALVSAEDAEYLTSEIDGFYYATPKEAQEFYG